jgi:hypothetical protein
MEINAKKLESKNITMSDFQSGVLFVLVGTAIMYGIAAIS